MSRLIIATLWLCSTALASAEIAAWRIELDKLLEDKNEMMPIRVMDPFDAEEVEKALEAYRPELNPIKEPPEESVFFRKGDVLKAFSPRQIEASFGKDSQLEWVVWNESTSRLVTKTNATRIAQMRHYLREPWPRYVRTTLKCYEVTNAEEPPSDKAKLLHEITALTQSLEGADLQSRDGDQSIELGLRTDVSECMTLIGTGINAMIQLKANEHYEFSTRIWHPAGKPMWIARDFDGKTGIDIQLHSEVALADGSPMEQWLMIEKDGKAMAGGIPIRARRIEQKIGKNHQLVKQFAFNRHVAILYLHTHGEPREDRGWLNELNDYSLPIPQEAIDLIETSEVPEAIRGWFPHPVWNLKSLLKAHDIEMGENDFVGHDPRTGRVFLYTDGKIPEDFLWMISHGSLPEYRAQHRITWEHEGQSQIVYQSGMRANIYRVRRHPHIWEIIRALEFEPTTGEDQNLTRSRLALMENSQEDHKFELSGAYSSFVDQWKTISETEGPGGKQTGRIKLERIDIHEH